MVLAPFESYLRGMDTFIVMVRKLDEARSPMPPQAFAARFKFADQAGDAVLERLPGAALLGVARVSADGAGALGLAHEEVRPL